MNTKLFLTLSATLGLSSLVATASPVTPAYTTFGDLPGATYGGTGINTSATAISTFSTPDGDNGIGTVTLGLTTNPKYPAPPVGFPLANDGAGTFSTAPGTVGTSANWNFDFYVNVSGGLYNLNSFVFTLFYGNNNAPLQSAVLSPAYGADPNSTSTIQNSFNLSFAFLAVPGFDPNAAGQYAFALQASLPNGGPVVANNAIVVNVGTPSSSVPDASSTATLLGLALGGLIWVNAAKKRSQTA